MERSSKRGKIPQNDWPSIIARYEAGETLASIARTYDCSAPAISYIVSRSRARDAAAETAAPPEPELVKGRTVDTPSSDLRQTASDGGTRASEISSKPHIERVPGEAFRIEPRLPADVEIARASEIRREPQSHQGNGLAERSRAGQSQTQPAVNANSLRLPSPAGVATQHGIAPRTLHLSLPQDDALPEPSSDRNDHGSLPSVVVARIAPSPPTGQQNTVEGGQGDSGRYPTGGHGDAFRMGTAPQRTQNGGSFIDQTLRARVDGDIAAFLTAFDAALAGDTADSRAGLREATDRLLRAGARTRIELERLEARVPLPPRDNGGPRPSTPRER